jgi:hypothetical protein
MPNMLALARRRTYSRDVLTGDSIRVFVEYSLVSKSAGRVYEALVAVIASAVG